MAKNTAPTKGNLMAAKNTLRLSKQGYEMLDKKRNILVREMMELIEKSKGGILCVGECECYDGH